MNISAKIKDERVRDVRCDADNLIVDLMDGRTISAPLACRTRGLRVEGCPRPIPLQTFSAPCLKVCGIVTSPDR
jgi:hypothetical protein